MENMNIDTARIEDDSQLTDASLRELSDFQLAIVGGGCGEVTPY